MEENTPVCEYLHIHRDIVKTVRGEMPSDSRLGELAELYRIFGDPTRIRILYVLFSSPVCVCDIANLLGMTVSAISHQLRILKQSKLVRYHREGKTVFYALADDHVRTMLSVGMDHICEEQETEHEEDL